jgi:F-type H+-transporting ATPase subunit gamma
MSTQQQIRHRLRSVKNILHITQAMEIVASVQFRKLLHRMEHFRTYAEKLAGIIGRLNSAADAQHPLFQQRPRAKVGVIVIAGDKGLCGSYNEHIFAETEKLLKTFPREQVELVIFGKKAFEHFTRGNWQVLHNHIDYTRKLTEDNIREWSVELTADFEEKQYDELWMVYTNFRNVLAREPRIEKILPLEKEQVAVERQVSDFIFEPSPEDIYQRIIPYFFYTKLQSHLLESYASELASRMIAMKSAAKNAEEMIDTLTLVMNKNRQLSITNEILEITAGAESLR